nr:hypothetical protein GCM10020093_024910 [Planobispora longispora]
MTTVAYCAVAPEGRTTRKQIWMRPEAVPGLRRLAEAVHAEGRPSPRRSGTPGRWRTRPPPGCPRWARPGASTRWA